MFNFNTTLGYGLRLLINLAMNGKKPKPLKIIAKEEGISLPYLRKLIILFEKDGMVKSLRGPGGGFVLGRKPAEISLSEITGILSSRKVMDCLKGSPNCGRYGDCIVRDLLEEVYDKVQSVFESKTLASIIRRRIK